MFYRLSPELALRSRWRPHWPRPGERVLVLTTGSVFPPGHTATRLCLDLLPEALAGVPDPRLLDVGCGSGVLLLAAVAAGARFGVGVDLSGRAAATTRDNARDNGLADSVQVIRGSTESLRGAFGVILANLPWAVQMDKVAEFTRLAAPGARLILSGFKDTQEDGTPGPLCRGGVGPEKPSHPGRVGHRTAAGEELHLGGLAVGAALTVGGHCPPFIVYPAPTTPHHRGNDGAPIRLRIFQEVSHDARRSL